MAKYADWYAVELDGYLKGRISDVQRFEAIKEIQNHFSEHIDDLVEKGMDTIEAEKAAIKSFGNPRNAALNLMHHGSRVKIGEALFWLCSIAIVVGMCLATYSVQGTTYSTGYHYEVNMVSAEITIGLFLVSLLGALLAKKVPIGKYAVALATGAVMSGGFLLVGPQPHFANVDPRDYDKTVALWKSGQEATDQIAKIENDIHLALLPEGANPNYFYSGTSGEQFDKTKAIAKIETLGPRLLNITPRYVHVGGTLTSGYLVPTLNMENHGYWAFRNRYVIQAEPDDKSPTGDIFPSTNLKLKYAKTPDDAIAAWQRYYNSGYYQFEYMVQSQASFLERADSVNRKSRFEMAMMILGIVTGISFVNLLAVLVVGWLATKIPNLTIHASFRRKLA